MYEKKGCDYGAIRQTSKTNIKGLFAYVWPWDKIHLYYLTWPMWYNAIYNLKISNSPNIMCDILQSCFSNLAHIKSFP